MWTAIRQEVRNYGEETTIRGVPRIFKSNSRLVRTMWSLAVMTSFTILLWQLSETFQNYFQYPITVVYKEGTGRSTFPDITVCNLNALAYDRYFSLTWDAYLNMTAQKRKAYDKLVNSTMLNNGSEYDYIWSYIQSTTGYYASLPYTELSSVGLQEKMIIDSNFFEWNWYSNNNATNLTVYLDPNYRLCYKLTPTTADRTKFRGLSFIVYINNFPNSIRTYRDYNNFYFPHPNSKEANGIRLALHPPGTQPNLDSGLDIGPGRKTTLHISSTIRNRLPKPHGNCTKQTHLEEHIYPDEKAAEKYTKSACLDTCFQRIIIQHCGCVTLLLSYTRRQLYSVNGTICANQSMLSTLNVSNLEGFIYRLECALGLYTFINSDLDLCESQCADSCKELEYTTIVSSVSWPPITSQLNFYATYIAKDKYNIFSDMQFQEYRDLYDSNMTDAEILEKLKSMHLLEDNFMQIDIVFDKLNPMELTETPLLNPVKMLVDVGSVFSLWLGITVINAAEIVHFLVSVIIAVHRSRRATSSSCDDTARGEKPTNSQEVSDIV